MVLVTASGSNQLITNFNFDRLTDIDSHIVARTSRSLVITVDGLRYAFTGANVRYNSFDEPIAGTITALDISRNGAVLLHVDGFSVGAPAFYLATYAPQNPLSLIFAGNDEFRGGALDDDIRDSAGHNVIIGGAGRDVLSAGDGNDHIYGGTPNGGDDGDDTIFGGGGSDYLQGNAGNDVIHGEDGSDRLIGGQGDDVIHGGPGNDSANGTRGNDSILGGSGNDSLRGGQGRDSIRGGDGDDILLGDTGADRLFGDAGHDLFVFGPGSSPISGEIDRVEDFTPGEDHLLLGFLPAAILTGIADPYASASGNIIGSARPVAQQLLDGHVGDQAVAIITVIRQTYLFWDADRDGLIDSAVDLRSTSVGSTFFLSDFV